MPWIIAKRIETSKTPLLTTGQALSNHQQSTITETKQNFWQGHTTHDYIFCISPNEFSLRSQTRTTGTIAQTNTI